MPKRDNSLYIEDILDSAEAIKEFTEDLTFEDFINFIVYEYFGVDAKIIWDLTTQELDELVEQIKKMKGRI